MQQFSNYFVQILLIRSRWRGVQRCSSEGENISRGAAPPTSRAYGQAFASTRNVQWE